MIDDLNDKMQAFGAGMTKYQTAITVATAISLQNPKIKYHTKVRYKNIMVKIPPAGGKTRIGLGILILLTMLRGNHATKIAFIHPNEELKSQDDDQFN